MVLEHNFDAPMETWSAGSLKVSFRSCLDGAGTDLAGEFVPFIKMFCPDRVFNHAFEWCSGPGFIGFSLLDAGICSRLSLGDINPEAVKCVQNTIRENDLSGKVSVFESDNFKSIPADYMFDLVVANPPNYCNLNENHPWGNVLTDDLRPHDPGWSAHSEFYRTVSAHLVPGSIIFVAEVEPFKRRVHIPADEKEPYDIRERAPIEDFADMIAGAGLSLLDVSRFVAYENGAEYWMLTIEKTAV